MVRPSHASATKNDFFEQMENEILNPQNSQPQEEEIDLLELAGRLWQRRKFIIKTAIVGMVIGLVVAFSIPKEYTVTVVLAPESRRVSSSSISMAAQMLGLSELTTQRSDYDALNIMLFPDILDSDPFALELYSMEVTTSDGEEMPLYEYMGTQRTAWWSWVMGLPFKAVGAVVSLFKSEDEADGDGELNPFRLSKEETKRVKAIKESMTAVVDQKTGVTTIDVTMQDAVVTAMVADNVVTKLQSYITEYRIKKSITYCDYLEKVFNESQQDYYDAQQRYANYLDENKSLYTRRSMVEGERLQNDMNMAYNIYSQVASQLQLANARLQIEKPVFAVVNPATVPLKPSAPRKLLILVGFIFLAGVGAAAWVLFGENLWAELRKSATTPTAATTTQEE